VAAAGCRLAAWAQTRRQSGASFQGVAAVIRSDDPQLRRRQGWLNRRYGAAYPDPEPLHAIARALVASIRWWFADDRERARFRAIDAIVLALDRAGRLRDNSVRMPDGLHPQARVVVITDTFPDACATAVAERLAAIVQAGCVPRIEATHRPTRQDLIAVRAYAANYREDESPPVVWRSLIWLWTHDPLRMLAEARARLRSRKHRLQPKLREIAPMAVRLRRGGERHVHVLGSGEVAAIAAHVAHLSGRETSVGPQGDADSDSGQLAALSGDGKG
jgi:hypothetical protein